MLPLGSGALAGNPFGVDRMAMAKAINQSIIYMLVYDSIPVSFSIPLACNLTRPFAHALAGPWHEGRDSEFDGRCQRPRLRC